MNISIKKTIVLLKFFSACCSLHNNVNSDLVFRSPEKYGSKSSTKNIPLSIVLLLIFSRLTNAGLIPSAETESKITITAQITGGGYSDNNGIYLVPSPSTLVGAYTTTYTNAISMNPILPRTEIASGALGQTINVHAASSSSSVSLNLGTNITTGGIDNDPATIAIFQGEHSTFAAALSPQPLFSKAGAASQGFISNFIIQNAFTSDNFPPSNSFNPSLNLTWGIDQLKIKSEPTTALAYMRDTMEIMQYSGGKSTTTTIGFISSSENGKESTQYFEYPTTKTIEDWFNTNVESTPNQLILKDAPDNFSISIPLLDEFLNPQQHLALSLQNDHTEFSYEAPPRATIQVGEEIGHALFNSPSESQMHWDKERNLLYFDPLPINGIGKYQDDPLNGGYIKIDPLIHFASLDGREYFSGNELKLIDKFGDILYKASLPTLVFEDDLSQLQGFNMFAPILNILEAYPDSSAWLQNYFKEINFESALLPELFLGFNQQKLGTNIWKQSFDTGITTMLSFSGPRILKVTEPSSLLLLSYFLIFLGFYKLRGYFILG
ncbi:MAG: hypothetical protein ACU4EQ_10580 [Candidatus Nitrosoglobus sp.]